MSRYYPECRVNLSVVFDGFGGKDKPQVIEDIIPLTASVNLNSYKEADTWEITFDSQRFPFSPELVKSVGVEIYLYQREDLTQEPFYADAPQSTFLVQGIADTASGATGADLARREKLLVTGLVDNFTLTQDEEGGVVSMSGRDYTGLLLDKQWDPEKSGKRGRIPDGPLDQIVQQLVDEAVNADETGRTLQVVFLDYDAIPNTSNVSKTVTHKTVKIHIKSPPKTTKSRSTRKKRGVAVKSDSNYWDVIYKLCMSYGFISFVQNFNIYITRPHVLYADQEALWGYWRVAYGRNLESLEVQRKLSKEAVPQIRVRSYDPKSKIAIEGRYPADKDKGEFDTDPTGKKTVREVRTGIGTKKEEYRVYTVPDITDTNTLTEIAKTTYNTLAKGEGTITFKTPALQDLDNRDLLRIRAGDAVFIEWDAFDSKLMTNSKLGTDEKVSALLALGYKPDVAQLVASQYDKLDYFRQNFYVRNAKIDWSFDSGVSIEVEAINFVNASPGAS